VDYLEYRRLTEASRAHLSLPPDCKDFLPLHYEFTNRYFWTVEWVLKFDDRKHMRLREHYTKIAGLDDSRRKLFSFHYGETVAEEHDGTPISRHDDPVDIRIDNAITGIPHLHYGLPGPHHQQASIKGKLDLGAVGMFEFVKAILRHRKSRASIEDVLHFRVRPAAK
jgi:hypothetical protein